MKNKIKYVFTTILLISIISCKGQKEEKTIENKREIPSKSEKKSTEIYIGKIFFSGEELQDYQFVKGNITTADSISYSIYQNISNKKYVFSLEKLLKNDDVEKYTIIDTFNINVPINGLIIEKRSNKLSLVYNKKILKRWTLKKDNQTKNLWKGEYSVNIDYGKLDEFSEMQIGYDIEIDNNKCIFSGMGYKTYFTDQCKIKEKDNLLVLTYYKSIDSDGITDHSKIDTLAILTLKSNKYYIKSPVIADKDWIYNVEILLNKK